MQIRLWKCSCDAPLLLRIPRRAWMRWIPYMRLYSCYNCKQEVFTKPQPLLLKDPSAERFWEHTTIKPTDSRNLSTLEAHPGKAP